MFTYHSRLQIELKISLLLATVLVLAGCSGAAPPGSGSLEGDTVEIDTFHTTATSINASLAQVIAWEESVASVDLIVTEVETRAGEDEIYVFLLDVAGELILEQQSSDLSGECEAALSSSLWEIFRRCGEEMHSSFYVHDHAVVVTDELEMDTGDIRNPALDLGQMHVTPPVIVRDDRVTISIPVHLVVAEIYDFDKPTEEKKRGEIETITERLEAYANSLSLYTVMEQGLLGCGGPEKNEEGCVVGCYDEDDPYYPCDRWCERGKKIAFEARCVAAGIEEGWDEGLDALRFLGGDPSISIEAALMLDYGSLEESDLIGRNSILFTSQGYLIGADYMQLVRGDPRVLFCHWTPIEHWRAIPLRGFYEFGANYELLFELDVDVTREAFTAIDYQLENAIKSVPQNFDILCEPAGAQFPTSVTVLNTDLQDIAICGVDIDSRHFGTVFPGMKILSPGESYKIGVSFEPPYVSGDDAPKQRVYGGTLRIQFNDGISDVHIRLCGSRADVEEP